MRAPPEANTDFSFMLALYIASVSALPAALTSPYIKPIDHACIAHTMIRISFRQSMLAGLLLIAALLGWVTLRSWLLLEHFLAQSRLTSEYALQLNDTMQELSQSTLDLERTVRQFIVLKDPALLTRFEANADRGLAAIARFRQIPRLAPEALMDDWSTALSELAEGLRNGALPDSLLATLDRLNEINGSLDRKNRQWIDEQHASIRTELQQNRMQLAGLIATSFVGAFLVALAMSRWLTRPVEKLEKSIDRLGEGRFHEPIEVRGPADLHRIGHRLDWLRLRLEELESGREQTLRHVSHELKTPLTALREGIALLEEEVVGHLDEAQKEVVDILQQNILILQKHIESLLRLNALALETRRLNRQPVALQELLSSVVTNHELHAQSRQLTIECQAPAATRQLDAEKLRVVLDNLLSNAIDFSPTGGLIRLDAKIEGGILRIICADQGPGVAPEDAERIFEPFVQGNRMAPIARRSSGVGLSIARELMTAMDGQICLLPNGENTRGATFELELPCAHHP